MNKEKLDFNILVADSDLNIRINSLYYVTKIFVSYGEETIFLKHEKNEDHPVYISELQYLVNLHPNYNIVFVNENYSSFKIARFWISDDFNFTVIGRIYG